MVYHQVAVEPSYIHKIAFLTKNRLFKFLVLPFGLVNAPAPLYRIVYTSFEEALEHLLLAYFDDSLVYSETMDIFE